MPILNRDILHEILIESLDLASTRPLANFMMAGKETFKIALDYFGRAKSVKVEYGKVIVHLPNFHDKIKQYEISYDFELLKPILAAAGSSIEELDICNASPLAQQRNILGYLIQKDLKKVSLSTKLPDHYNNLLKQSRIESFSVSLNGPLDQLTMIPDSCRFLRLQDVNINDLFEKSIKKSFPNVRELVIDEGEMQNLNIKRHKEFASFISYTFPALQSLDVNYELLHPFDWASIKDTFVRFDPSVFNKLRANVKGSIRIQPKDLYGLFQTALDYTHGKPYITANQESKCIEKNFEIHNGLSFSSSFCFEKPRSRRNYDDGDDYEFVDDGYDQDYGYIGSDQDNDDYGYDGDFF